jgi:hypothetical protein
MNDFVIAEIATNLAASKNRQYKEIVVTLYQTLVRFLQENHLTVRELLASNQTIPSDFQLRQSDVTEDGFHFLRNAFHPWIEGIAEGRWPPNDKTVLKEELAKLVPRK